MFAWTALATVQFVSSVNLMDNFVRQQINAYLRPVKMQETNLRRYFYRVAFRYPNPVVWDKAQYALIWLYTQNITNIWICRNTKYYTIQYFLLKMQQFRKPIRILQNMCWIKKNYASGENTGDIFIKYMIHGDWLV